MAKGFVAGAVWGLVVSAAGAAAVSLAVGVAPIVDAPPAPEDIEVAVLPADPGEEVAPDPVDAATPPEETPQAEARTPEAALPDTPPLRFEDTTEPPPEAAAPSIRRVDAASACSSTARRRFIAWRNLTAARLRIVPARSATIF